ncbi:fimbria/pilus outer membrane usher protein [Dyella silvatica]|uniref:fimbria/pilus outer membrane usher protein n=1 Tax=Dyella silvatica TaxID=2992128 RepID=UPI00225C1ED5|nr:fimbria/pilus outer membrane usher protein [Dyella silvatica]
MMARRTLDRARRTRGFSACRHGLLCLTIASVLAGLPALTLAAPAAAATGAAAPSGADASAAVDASFDRNLLSGAGRNTGDISRFERSNPVLPGVYRTDIYLNNVWVGRSDVRFAAATPDASATACVTQELFKQLGLPLNKLSAEQQAQLAGGTSCLDLGQLIPSATVVFDQPNLRVDMSVPQAWMGYRPRGYVSPEYWDNGVNAGLLNYNFNSYHSTSNGISQTSSFLGLNAGLNIGAWRLRHDSTMLWQSGTAGSRSSQHWQNIDTYLRRDIPSLRAQLTLGDSYTSGDLFDSISVRGVQLATDDRMLPDSLRGYAPTVRGVAESNARVTVRQNGVVLYETTVSPGPFTINDLYSTGYGGDLNVSVTEADGRVRSFTVPYASVPQLLRPGVSRFSLVAGELHDTSLHAHPALVQATLQHGFNNLLTGYAGVVAFNGYAAALAGSALNTRYGAFAMDLTAARTEIPGHSTQTGQSVRLSYSKILPDTNTSLTVATYRYSTSGYLGLRDALAARDYARGYSVVDPTELSGIGTVNGTLLPGVLTPAQRQALGTNSNSFTPFATQLDRQRSRFDLTLNQHLGERGGTLYATASARDYWNRNGTDVQFQLGYNNTFRHFSYSVSATRVRDILGRYSNQFFASFTVPLGNSVHAPMFGASVNHDGSGRTLDQLMLNGTAGTDNQFSYGATASHDTGGSGSGNSGTVYGGYRSPYAQLNASYGKGSNYSQSSFGLSGGIVAHPGGITFGQPMGDTVAIVVAPDAQGARVLNAAGVRIDRFGYALVPFLTPYNLNTVQIDPKGLPLSVQMDATSAQVAPHLGSVVMVSFKTSSGRSLIVRVRQANGQSVPFGAEVLDEQNHTLGVVGQAGRILVRGVKDSGQLSVQWKNDDETPMSCSFSYQLPPGKKASATDTYEKIEATCTPQSDAVAQTRRNGT